MTDGTEIRLLEERLAAIVKIHTPGVTCPVREDLKRMPRRMVAPNGRVDPLAIFVRRSWLANTRMRKHSMAAIEPTVRPPNECVQRFVGILVSPTIQKNLWRAICNIVTVGIGNKK